MLSLGIRRSESHTRPPWSGLCLHFLSCLFLDCSPAPSAQGWSLKTPPEGLTGAWQLYSLAVSGLRGCQEGALMCWSCQPATWADWGGGPWGLVALPSLACPDPLDGLPPCLVCRQALCPAP